MPDLGIDDFNAGAIASNTRANYIATVKYQQRGYYWMLLALGSFLFLVGAFI